MATNHKQIVQEVNEAFSSGNIENFIRHCADDVRWTMAGHAATEGIPALREMMKGEEWDPPVINVRATIAEGDIVACEGTMSMSKKTGERFEGSFCDVYRFRDGKIGELTSFVVEMKSGKSAPANA